MPKTGRRTKPRDTVEGGNQALDICYNPQSGSLKTLGPITGTLTPLGSAAAPINVTIGQLIAFYNPTASAMYVTFGSTNAVTAPADGSTGLALRPNDYTILTAQNNWVIASGAAWAYLVVDDSVIQ